MANTISLRVDGVLRSSRQAAPPRATVLQGRVTLRIAADIPPLIAFTPGLDAIVTGILEAILDRLEAALRKGLLEDYDAWVREQRAAAKSAATAAAAAASAAGHMSALQPEAQSPSAAQRQQDAAV